MNGNENINRNDPLFLVSRACDGDLTSAEQTRLDELLAASPEFRIEAEKLRAVAQLVIGRRTSQPQIDWKLGADLVLAQIEDEDSDLAGVENALQAWGTRTPQYDPAALTHAVMTRIAPAQQRKRSAWRVIARIGAPLAAAAAVVIAVTATWFSPVANDPMFATPVTLVRIGPAASIGASDSSVSIVTFSRMADRPAAGDEALSFGYMTLGSSPIAQVEESPL